MRSGIPVRLVWKEAAGTARPIVPGSEQPGLPAAFAEARTAFSQGRYADALRLARAAVQESPDSAQCLTFLGCVLEVSDQTAEAMKVLGQATSLAPDDPEPWRQLGCVFTRSAKSANRFVQAERCFGKAAMLAAHRAIY